MGFIECAGGVVVNAGGFNVWSVESGVVDVDGFDGMVKRAAERVVRVIVGAGMGLVECVRQVVGFEVDVDGLGISTLTIISCSSASWESDSSPSSSSESDSASSRSQSLRNMSPKSFAASEVSTGKFASREVSLLGASISAVMTSGLKGWIPVLQKAVLIFPGVRACMYAFVMTLRKFDLLIALPLSHNSLSCSLPRRSLRIANITMSRPW